MNAPGRRSTPCSIGPLARAVDATPVRRPRPDCRFRAVAVCWPSRVVDVLLQWPRRLPPTRFEFGSGRVGRERTISREECPATSAGHSPCLREVNVPDGRRSPLPSPDTVVCQERVARHLAFCPTPAPATIRYGVPLVLFSGRHGAEPDSGQANWLPRRIRRTLSLAGC